MTDKKIKSNVVFEQLNDFAGKWKGEISHDGIPLARSKTSFKWFENHSFLIQHTEAEPPLPTTPPLWIENDPNPLVVVIGFDDNSEQFYYVYADARGVRRVYRMSLENGVWEIWGQAGPKFFQHFEGKFSGNKNSIVGKW